MGIVVAALILGAAMMMRIPTPSPPWAIPGSRCSSFSWPRRWDWCWCWTSSSATSAGRTIPRRGRGRDGGGWIEPAEERPPPALPANRGGGRRQRNRAAGSRQTLTPPPSPYCSLPCAIKCRASTERGRPSIASLVIRRRRTPAVPHARTRLTRTELHLKQSFPQSWGRGRTAVARYEQKGRRGRGSRRTATWSRCRPPTVTPPSPTIIPAPTIPARPGSSRRSRRRDSARPGSSATSPPARQGRAARADAAPGSTMARASATESDDAACPLGKLKRSGGCTSAANPSGIRGRARLMVRLSICTTRCEPTRAMAARTPASRRPGMTPSISSRVTGMETAASPRCVTACIARSSGGRRRSTSACRARSSWACRRTIQVVMVSAPRGFRSPYDGILADGFHTRTHPRVTVAHRSRGKRVKAARRETAPGRRTFLAGQALRGPGSDAACLRGRDRGVIPGGDGVARGERSRGGNPESGSADEPAGCPDRLRRQRRRPHARRRGRARRHRRALPGRARGARGAAFHRAAVGARLLRLAVREGGGKGAPRLEGDLPPDGRRRPRQRALGRLAHATLFREFRRLLHSRPWNVCVSTHFLPCQLAAGRPGLPRFGLVVTDFGLHRMWVQPGASTYYVATDTLADALRRRVRRARIEATGIPIDPVFAHAPSQADARAALGLAPDRPVALVMGGGLGIGVEEGVMAALRSTEPGVQLLAVCGRERRARCRLASAGMAEERLRVYGHVCGMEQYLAAADVVVGKPGGLTVSETLALGKPLLLTRPIPARRRRTPAPWWPRARPCARPQQEALRAQLRRLFHEPGLLAACPMPPAASAAPCRRRHRRLREPRVPAPRGGVGEGGSGGAIGQRACSARAGARGRGGHTAARRIEIAAMNPRCRPSPTARAPAAGVPTRAVPQVKPRAVCEAFRRCCGGFSRSALTDARERGGPGFIPLSPSFRDSATSILPEADSEPGRPKPSFPPARIPLPSRDVGHGAND